METIKDKLSKLFNSNGSMIAIGSLLYGIQIFKYSHILETFEVYNIVDSLFNNQVIGGLIIVASLIKIIGNIFELKRLRQVGIVALSFIWGLFFVSFLITPPPNTVWSYALTYCLILIKASVRERW